MMPSGIMTNSGAASLLEQVVTHPGCRLRLIHINLDDQGMWCCSAETWSGIVNEHNSKGVTLESSLADLIKRMKDIKP